MNENAVKSGKVKRIAMGVAWSIIQFVPLSVFLILAETGDDNYDPWPRAFMTGGSIAAIGFIIVWNFAQRLRFDRLLIGVNVFLIIGGLITASDNESLIGVYRWLREAAMFGWIIVVGLIATLSTKRGFIDVEHNDSKTIQRASWLALICCGIAFGISFYFRGGGSLWAAPAPFIGLVIARRLVQWRCITSRQ